MRLALIAAVLGVAAASVLAGASAEPASPYQRAMGPYFAELAKQCPAKHLDELSPGDLRDALDDFKDRQPREQREHLNAIELSSCARSAAGATCANVADIGAANDLQLTPLFAAKVCQSFKVCREQSDCDAVTKP